MKNVVCCSGYQSFPVVDFFTEVSSGSLYLYYFTSYTLNRTDSANLSVQ